MVTAQQAQANSIYSVFALHRGVNLWKVSIRECAILVAVALKFICILKDSFKLFTLLAAVYQVHVTRICTQPLEPGLAKGCFNMMRKR